MLLLRLLPAREVPRALPPDLPLRDKIQKNQSSANAGSVHYLINDFREAISEAKDEDLREPDLVGNMGSLGGHAGGNTRRKKGMGGRARAIAFTLHFRSEAHARGGCARGAPKLKSVKESRHASPIYLPDIPRSSSSMMYRYTHTAANFHHSHYY